MIKVSNFQALITNGAGIHSDKYRELQQQINPNRPGTQTNSPDRCLSPIHSIEAQPDILMEVQSQVNAKLVQDSSINERSVNGSGSGESGGSKKVVVISTDSAGAQDKSGMLHVTANSVQPIFKVHKVPSNSLGSNSHNTNSDKSYEDLR